LSSFTAGGTDCRLYDRRDIFFALSAGLQFHSSRFLVALRQAHVSVFYIIGWPAMMGKAARLPLSIMMQEHDDAHSAAAG
jgi:hypothetical protein